MEIEKIERIVQDNGIVFLTYGEFISQSLIAGITESLELETSHNNINIGISNNIFTVFIELSQNIMNYAKSKNTGEDKPEGIVLIRKDEQNYYIYSQNIISKKDIDVIKPILEDIISLDKQGIKDKYRKLRRTKKELNNNSKGAGIGFYEIAKRSEKISYRFKNLNNGNYNFYLKSTIYNK